MTAGCRQIPQGIRKVSEMIEIICDKEREKKDMPWRELPKNVRQIGDTKEKRKIYIEDFVVTYLARLAKPDHAYARGAILLGDIYQTEEGIAVFIHGALEAQNLELDMDDTIFNEKIWSELLEQREKYFPGQAVVGWFLSRIGFSVEMNQKIIKAHLQNFPGNHKVLYMMDSLENEDAFYICENQQLIRQRGYYIYYEKNSAMREYMLAEKGEEVRGTETDEREQEQIRRDKKVIRNYRRVNHYGRQNQKQKMQIRLTRIASMLVIVGTLSYALYQMRGDQWMSVDMRSSVVETMTGLRSKLRKEESVVVDRDKVTTEIEKGMDETDLNETSGTEAIPEEGNTSSKEEKVKDSLEPENVSEKKTQETAAEVQGKPLYYTVQKGDTLAAISRRMYTTDKYASQIAKVNDMADENEIFIGQKILIPSIE